MILFDFPATEVCADNLRLIRHQLRGVQTSCCVTVFWAHGGLRRRQAEHRLMEVAKISPDEPMLIVGTHEPGDFAFPVRELMYHLTRRQRTRYLNVLDLALLAKPGGQRAALRQFVIALGNP